MKTSSAMPSKRCAIYTRKSTSQGLEQEFNSLDAQREACERYIKTQPGWSVAAVYDDGGFSGANIARPGFQRLLADVQARKVDVVVVYKVDRLSRSLLDFAKVMDIFNGCGAAFVSVTQNFSTADAMGRLTLNMMMSFAEFEREMIAERTRDKIRATRRKGRWTGGPPPLGYDLVAGRLVVNEVEAVAVREIFTLYLQYRSLFAVIADLKTRGRRPKRHVSKAGAVRQCDNWDKRVIVRTLRNPVYIGRMPCNGDSFDGEHAPIVALDIFEKANAALGGRKQSEPRPSNYLLKGLVFCSVCGSAMTSASSRRHGQEYRYYRCRKRELQGAGACTTKPISAKAIEPFVINRIREATADGALAERLGTQMLSGLREERKVLLNEQLSARLEVTRLSAETQELMTEATAATASRRQKLQARLAEVGDKIAHHERREADTVRGLAELDRRESDGEWLVEAVGNFDRLWEQMMPENRQRLVGAIVERILVSGGGGQFQIDVQLAALGSVELKEAS